MVLKKEKTGSSSSTAWHLLPQVLRWMVLAEETSTPGRVFWLRARVEESEAKCILFSSAPHTLPAKSWALSCVFVLSEPSAIHQKGNSTPLVHPLGDFVVASLLTSKLHCQN